MIDFIKILDVPIDVNEIYNNKFLNLQFQGDKETGEILKQKAVYKGLTFEIFKDRYVNISGSLHKYHNNGEHNYNDFTLVNLLDVLIDIYNKFKINPLDALLSNIEFGVNVNTPFVPKNAIKHNIIIHQGQPASIKTFRQKGYLKEFEHSQFYIKIYDKGLHYNQNENIFRFELKVVKMEYLKKIGIKTLADLLNLNKLQLLGQKLNEIFNEILIIDEVDTKEFTQKEKLLYLTGTNPKFWETLKPNSKNYTDKKKYNADRQKYYYEFKVFNKLVLKYNLAQTKNVLSNLISEKWNELKTLETKKSYKLTAFLNYISEQKVLQIDRLFNYQNSDKKENIEKLKVLQNDTSNIELICKKNQHKCKVTKIDISMQKKTSEFLSISGIKFYKENRPEIYKELEKRLSSKWNDCTPEIKINEIAHSIRNEFFNLKHNTKKRILKLYETPSLFQNRYIDKDKLLIAGF